MDKENKDLISFNKILDRIEIEKFYLEDNFIIGKPLKNNYLLLFEIGSELKKIINIQFEEINPLSEEFKKIKLLTNAASSTNWIQIPSEFEIYLSKIFVIKTNYDYNIDINRDQMPFKLLKSEYKSIYYTLKDNILLIKKVFEAKNEGFNFSVIRGFQFV